LTALIFEGPFAPYFPTCLLEYDSFLQALLVTLLAATATAVPAGSSDWTSYYNVDEADPGQPVYDPAYQYYGAEEYQHEQPESRAREWYEWYLPQTTTDERQDGGNPLDGVLASVREGLTGIGRRVVSGFTRLTGIDPVESLRR